MQIFHEKLESKVYWHRGSKKQGRLKHKYVHGCSEEFCQWAIFSAFPLLLKLDSNLKITGMKHHNGVSRWLQTGSMH